MKVSTSTVAKSAFWGQTSAYLAANSAPIRAPKNQAYLPNFPPPPRVDGLGVGEGFWKKEGSADQLGVGVKR